MMWSSVPNVRSGMRTLSPSSFSIWKACGVVTSWIRCRPISSWVWPDGSVRTVCASHTLSSSVRAMGIPPRGAYPAPGALCSPVKRSAANGKLCFMIDTALPVVRELWSGAEAAFGQLAALAGRPAVTLRVAVSDYLGKGLLAPVLRDLLDEEPPVRFEIVTTHSRAGVRLVAGGDVDLAVVTGQEIPRGLEERRLFDQPFVWVGPRRRRRDRAPLTE